jgi:hypothetical protein
MASCDAASDIRQALPSGVEAAAAEQFSRIRKRRVLQGWWLAAAETIARGPRGGNTAQAAAAMQEKAGPEP